jgi:predicted nuclease with TOPRIM domain
MSRQAVTLEDLADGQHLLMLSVDARFDNLDKDLKELREYVESGFDTMNGRFDRLEDRVDHLENGMDRLEDRMDGLDGRMGHLETSINGSAYQH